MMLRSAYTKTHDKHNRAQNYQGTAPGRKAADKRQQANRTNKRTGMIAAGVRIETLSAVGANRRTRINHTTAMGTLFLFLYYILGFHSRFLFHVALPELMIGNYLTTTQELSSIAHTNRHAVFTGAHRG